MNTRDFPAGLTARRAPQRRGLHVARWLACAACLLLLAGPAAAQRSTTPDGGSQTFTGNTPDSMQGAEVTQRLGEAVPLDLEFTNHAGETVTLEQYFRDYRPVIITPLYYNCPQLCTLVLNGLMDAMQRMNWTVGNEFQLITYSFDARETAELAAAKRKGYLAQYDRYVGPDNWPWLVGSEANIQALNDALGFGTRMQDDGVIAHSASIMFLTPDGRIAKYMNDVAFQPQSVKLALVETSEGTIGSPLQKFLLFTCFQYDPESNTYGPVAWKLMRSAGLLTLVGVACGLLILFVRGTVHAGSARSDSMPPASTPEDHAS